jgi:hypothetical protein
MWAGALMSSEKPAAASASICGMDFLRKSWDKGREVWAAANVRL